MSVYVSLVLRYHRPRKYINASLIDTAVFNPSLEPPPAQDGVASVIEILAFGTVPASSSLTSPSPPISDCGVSTSNTERRSDAGSKLNRLP